MSLLRPAYVSALLSDARFCPAARSGSDLITTPAGDFVSPTVCSVLQLIGNEGVPIQLAQCWLPGLAISDAKIYRPIYFSNEIYGSNFIKWHSKTYMV